MASNPNLQCKEQVIVIRKNVKIDKKRIQEWCEQNTTLYAFIEHEKDINLEGVLEGTHYHLVITLPKRKRLLTIANEIATFLGFENLHGIEFDKLKCLEGAIQYLIHKNDKQKTQHARSEIVSNYPKEELETLLDSDNISGALTFERVKEVCLNSNNLMEVIESIGFNKYHIFRNTIKDIWEVIQTQRKLQRELAEKKFLRGLNENL